jgi:hypothetical protein
VIMTAAVRALWRASAVGWRSPAVSPADSYHGVPVSVGFLCRTGWQKSPALRAHGVWSAPNADGIDRRTVGRRARRHLEWENREDSAVRVVAAAATPGAVGVFVTWSDRPWIRTERVTAKKTGTRRDPDAGCREDAGRVRAAEQR